MMAHLYFVEESITKIEKKATTINREAVSNINKEVSDLSELVNNFLRVDAPQYKKLVTESETRVDQRFLNFKDDLLKQKRIYLSKSGFIATDIEDTYQVDEEL